MKRSFTILLSAVMTLAAFGSLARADVPADLDKALADAATWKFGDDDKPMKTIETATFEAGKDATLRGPVETRLIAALKSSKSVDLRRFICRQLRTIGTARAIPALASLLGDADLTHGARYALGRIEDPKAAAALHDAMGKTKGNIQAGIIVTLAKRGYPAAIGDMARLFGSADKTVAHAAIRGVGVMGTSTGAKVLLRARTSASGQLRKRITDAMLECADKLTAGGKGSDAAVIYKVLYTPKEIVHVRLASLRGLARSQGSGAVNTLAIVIKGDDPQMRASAIALMTDVKDSSATKTLVDLLGTMKPESQTLILASLGARGDKSACPAVTKLTASEDKAVKGAALEALGTVGGAGSVPLLIKNAGTGGAERSAQTALMAIKGSGVDDAIIKAVASEETKTSIEAIKALRARGCAKAVDALFKAAVSKDSTVRRTSAEALGTLAGEKDINRLLAILVKPVDPKDRAALEHAAGTVFLSVGDNEKCAGKVLTATHSASGEAKAALVRLLGKVPTPKGLDAVKTLIKSSDKAVNDASVRTLADWSNIEPADAVIALARSTSNKTHRVLLLRGYVRMASMTKDPTDMCLQAMKLADSTQGKKLVLSGFGSAGTMGALNEVAKYFNDEKVREEAGLAAAMIGEKLKRSKERLQVKFILQKVLKFTKSSNTRRRVQKIVKDIR
ncbi:MAG: HEAT repeat domain-containing protein [Phycisphaerae bacterium]|jgi:HEAT repeat protein|nr:HEAT repeat domain-containing protein [Phycisphaerae bacterium]